MFVCASRLNGLRRGLQSLLPAVSALSWYIPGSPVVLACQILLEWTVVQSFRGTLCNTVSLWVLKCHPLVQPTPELTGWLKGTMGASKLVSVSLRPCARTPLGGTFYQIYWLGYDSYPHHLVTLFFWRCTNRKLPTRTSSVLPLRWTLPGLVLMKKLRLFKGSYYSGILLHAKLSSS